MPDDPSTQELLDQIHALQQRISELEADTAKRPGIRNRTRALLAAIPDMIFHVSRDGRFLDVRAHKPNDLYLPPEQFLGRSVTEVMPPDFATPCMQLIAKTLEHGGIELWEYQLPMDQGLRSYEARFSRCAEAEVLIIVRDITDRIDAEHRRADLEAQIRHGQKLECLGVLAGGIAHDFNNLLVGILGNATLALRKLTPDAPARRNIEDLELIARRAAELTNQLLAYSGAGTFALEAVDLGDLVREMSQILGTAIAKTAILNVDIEPDLPSVRGDPAQLRQVVMNLITNASDAMGDMSGTISVRLIQEPIQGPPPNPLHVGGELTPGPYVVLAIADTGCGMTRAVLERIFDPFFTTKFTGRGLGLAAVQGIIQSHNGGITIETEPKVGTIFRVYLPAMLGVSAAPKAPGPKPPKGWHGAGTVLVIDDESIVREVAREVLAEAGFTVILACDGREGLHIFESNPAIRAVLLDMTMPVMSGEETLRALNRHRPETPVIICSGYSEQDTLDRLTALTVASFIQKPFVPDDLLNCLYQILR